MFLAHLSRVPPPRARPVQAGKDELGMREAAAGWAGHMHVGGLCGQADPGPDILANWPKAGAGPAGPRTRDELIQPQSAGREGLTDPLPPTYWEREPHAYRNEAGATTSPPGSPLRILSRSTHHPSSYFIFMTSRQDKKKDLHATWKETEAQRDAECSGHTAK